MVHSCAMSFVMEKVKMFIRRWLSFFRIASTNSTVLE